MLRLYAALFAIGLVGYGAVAWKRLGTQSGAPHFVYQADAWLNGSISVAQPLPNDDWAIIETVQLDDGSEVRGRCMVTTERIRAQARLEGTPRGARNPFCPNGRVQPVPNRPATPTPDEDRWMFKTLGGEEIPIERVRKSLGHTAYVSFPAFPALLMVPSALVFGRSAGDVTPTVFIAALILPLALLFLRRLADAGLSSRTVRDDLWLVAALAFGSVMFFSSVQGRVWYTAHVVGVVVALVYCWASIEGRHPVIAGLALGAAALTRTSMAFMFPLFLFELWRMAARDAAAGDEPGAHASGSLNLRAGRAAMRRAVVKPLVRFAIPIAAFALVGMIYNYVRFESPTEFGHSYLALGNYQPVNQQQYIETWGLAHYHYLSRNLAAAFTLLPELSLSAPYVSISGHGLAIWVTTPVLVLVLWPRERNALHRPLWITTLLVALPPFLYMNSGWFQFGYRFSLDYLVFLIALVAIGGRPFGRVAKTLIVAGVVINLFGAITFDRYPKYYRGSSSVVVPN